MPVSMRFSSPVLYGACLWLAGACGTGTAMAQEGAPTSMSECVADDSVQERFIPVELFTGNPLPQEPTLRFAPVERVYPYVASEPDGRVWTGTTQLQGPVQWTGEGGKDYEIYERKVPQAHERFALVDDKTAIGRVYDERWGNAANEGKFPVGVWKQGEKKTYNTVYYTQRGSRSFQTSVEIEKLSCTYLGIAGALQYRWRAAPSMDYQYIYAPGKGLVQVFIFKTRK